MNTKKTIHWIVLIFCLAAVCSLGVAVRWGVLDVQEAIHGGPSPFTMESALAYHYGEMAAESRLPLFDPNVNWPEGLWPWESHNLAAPVVLAGVYSISKNLLHGVMPLGLDDFYRRLTAVVYCLGILALFGCVTVSTGALLPSVLAAVGYAIFIPSVLRSTGQELMSENFALPLLWAHLFFFLLALKAAAGAVGQKPGKKFLLWVFASAFSLALSWSCWDMVQVYLWLLAGVAVVGLWSSRPGKAFHALLVIFTAVLWATAWASPYLRTHGAWAGGPMIIFGAAVVASFKERDRRWVRGGWFIVIAIALLVLRRLSGVDHILEDSYGHFSQLFWYKLKFLNIKPADPALLPYEVRALWVPALQSSDWTRIWSYFGPSFFLWIFSLGILCYRWMRGRLSVVEKMATSFGSIFGVLSLLFVRMEVFWIFFLCLNLVLAFPKRRIVKILWTAAILYVLFWQATALVVQAPYLGRNVDYRALNSLTDWIRQNTRPGEAMLASFSLSPSLITAADRPVALQPKYETRQFRQKAEWFGQALIAQDEDAFYSLCKKWDVRYYVHSKGFYADQSLNSFRYLVGVTQPSRKTNLAKFELDSQSLCYFRLIYQNEKYLVFRIVNATDCRKAQFCLQRSHLCLAQGHRQQALRWSYRALNLNPLEDEARLAAIRSRKEMGDVTGAQNEARKLFGRMQVRRLTP